MTKKREIITDVFKRMDYDSNTKTILYYTYDNRVLRRVGGERSWRLNNPGNLDFAGTTDLQKGRIGSAYIPGFVANGVEHKPHNAAVFESYDAGCKAQVDLLKRKYRDNTIAQMTEIYAPRIDHNDPVQYANELLAKTGISPTKTFREMTDEEVEKIAYNMRVKEGYFNIQSHSIEEWVGTTNISVSDGTKGIPNYPFKVVLGGKEYDWVTNDVGNFPTIFHTKDKMDIEIKATNAEGEEVIVYKTIGDKQTNNILLIKYFSQFTASTLPEQPDPPREKKQPEPIIYIIRSDDISLDSIATRYDVSTSELAKDNHLKEDGDIYPGKNLVIYNKVGSIVDQSENLPWEQVGSSGPVPGYPSIPSVKVEIVGSKNNGNALAPIPAIPDEAPWMMVAIGELTKFHEVNRTIISRTTDYISIIKNNPETSMRTESWCASFINYCLFKSNYPMWDQPWFARSVRISSDFKEIEKPVWGSIASMTSFSHVTLFYGYDKTRRGYFIGLGGNQGGGGKFNY